MKNNNKKLWIFGIAILFLVLTIFLISAVNVGNAVSTVKNKSTSSIKLTGVVITNPSENGLAFYFGTPIKFTAEPIFSGQQLNYPAITRYICKWTLLGIGNNPSGQILNPEPIINDCSITVTPGQNGIIYDSEMKIIVEVKTIDNVETIKTDYRLFNLVANPTPPNNNSLESAIK